MGWERASARERKRERKFRPQCRLVYCVADLHRAKRFTHKHRDTEMQRKIWSTQWINIIYGIKCNIQRIRKSLNVCMHACNLIAGHAVRMKRRKWVRITINISAFRWKKTKRLQMIIHSRTWANRSKPHGVLLAPWSALIFNATHGVCYKFTFHDWFYAVSSFQLELHFNLKAAANPMVSFRCSFSCSCHTYANARKNKC